MAPSPPFARVAPLNRRCTAFLLVGCFVALALAGSVSAVSSTAASAAVDRQDDSPQAQAAVEASWMLGQVMLPPGTNPLSEASVPILDQPEMISGSQLVHQSAFFATATMSAEAVIGFIRNHPPAGTTSAGEGYSYGPSASDSSWSIYFRPTKPGPNIENALLVVTAAAAPSGGSQERVDAEVVWQYPHPDDAIVASDVASARVSRLEMVPPGKLQTTRSVRLFPGAALARIVRTFNQLPVAVPGIVHCPADFGIRLRVAFPQTPTSAPIMATISSCGVVNLTINGQPGPDLNGRSSLPNELAAALGFTPSTVWKATESLPRFAGCTNRSPRIRPRAITVACADANFYVDHLKWSRWNMHDAAGEGKGHLNDCSPNCAAGHFHTYRVAVTLSHPVSCKPLSKLFTKLAWRFPGKRPARGARRGSVLFPCR